jgi:nucleoprotein TPR
VRNNLRCLTERHKLSQEQHAAQAREFDSLKKRYQQLYEQHTRLDISCNHATERWHDANAQIERLRNENANLKAEKQISEVSIKALRD